jgi:hypothetical protein
VGRAIGAGGQGGTVARDESACPPAGIAVTFLIVSHTPLRSHALSATSGRRQKTGETAGSSFSATYLIFVGGVAF